MDLSFHDIGVVHSPFAAKEDINAARNRDPEGFRRVRGELEIFPEYAPGLQDIDGFSHLIVIFAFHLIGRGGLWAHPPHDRKRRGVFSTRSPSRPNPIGMTVVALCERRKNRLTVEGIDMIEGTPILDIKPYTPRDRKEHPRFGWLEKASDGSTSSKT
jgi:tRNA-Thr(GGU) m(6)t(6)A37 methyltransferase TsaA